MRRLLASKSKNELLNLIRDLYTLTTANKDFVHAQLLTPKPKALLVRFCTATFMESGRIGML